MATRRHRLIERREAVGHTQESLAAAMDVDRTTVGRWESGRGTPQPWMRPKLARALRVNADQLAQLLDTPEQAASAVVRPSTAAHPGGTPSGYRGRAARQAQPNWSRL
ncbi:helix-turn-helix transcriptional regulator [Streptacidiphilus sp. 4-A2]|nr:helix-turn-helix transcriptional regulator [Streptacidiphilus sp. 4-A2]